MERPATVRPQVLETISFWSASLFLTSVKKRYFQRCVSKGWFLRLEVLLKNNTSVQRKKILTFAKFFFQLAFDTRVDWKNKFDQGILKILIKTLLYKMQTENTPQQELPDVCDLPDEIKENIAFKSAVSHTLNRNWHKAANTVIETARFMRNYEVDYEDTAQHEEKNEQIGTNLNMEEEYKNHLKRWSESGLRVKCNQFVSESIQEVCKQDYVIFGQYTLSNNVFEYTHKVSLLLATQQLVQLTLHTGPPFQPKGKIWNLLTEMKNLRVTICFVAWTHYDFRRDPWTIKEMKTVLDFVKSRLHCTITCTKLHDHNIKVATLDD